MSAQLNGNRRGRRFDLHWLILLLLILIVCAPLTYPGTIQAHSGFLPLYNLYHLETKGFTLTWAPTVGRAFDLLRGEGPLPYLLAELLRGLGASGVAAVKAIFGLGLLAGGLGMYGWGRRRLGRRGALLAALVYACWPYGLATLYVRGALAETLFLGILPWALWGLRSLQHRRPWAAAAVALSLALLIWTQAGLALWAAVVLLAYGLLTQQRARLWTVAGMAAGLLLGAAGLWPLMAERGPGASGVHFADHFVYPFQLLSPAWGQGTSVPGWMDSFPLQVGFVAVGLAVLAVIWLSTLPKADRQPEDARPLWVCAGLSMALVLLALTWAAPLWRLPGLSQASRSLTYPWQLLGLAGPFLALLSGSFVTMALGRAAKSQGRVLWAALVALTLLASYPYLQPLTTSYEPGAAPLAVLGENDLLLLDAQVAGPLQPGETAVLTVRWQPLRPLPQDYTVFVHALDGALARWGQQDTQPQSGEYPTSQWQVGEIVEDSYEVRIDAAGPPESYHLNLGLYDWQTGDRMKVGDDDKIIIGMQP